MFTHYNKSLTFTDWISCDISGKGEYLAYRYNAHEIQIDYYAATHTSAEMETLAKLPVRPVRYVAIPTTRQGELYISNDGVVSFKGALDYARVIATVPR